MSATKNEMTVILSAIRFTETHYLDESISSTAEQLINDVNVMLENADPGDYPDHPRPEVVE